MSFKHGVSRFFGSTEIPPLLREAGRPVAFPKGSTILREGDPLDAAYCMLEGSAVCGLGQADDQTSIVGYIEDGGFIGDADILSGSTVATLTFVAATDCRMLSYPSGEFVELTRNPEVAPYVTTSLAQKALGTAKMYIDATRSSALKRVALALLELDARHRKVVGGVSVIDFDVSQRYLADYLNLSRLTVNKCIGRLTSLGLVQRVNGRYSLSDRARFEGYLPLLE